MYLLKMYEHNLLFYNYRNIINIWHCQVFLVKYTYQTYATIAQICYSFITNGNNQAFPEWLR